LADQKKKHTISVLVNDEPGALARVIGLFSGRGYNIDSLNVAPVNLTKRYSRIIIVTSGTKMIINQIIHSLERLIQVKKVIDLTSGDSTSERELALIKVIPRKNKINLLKKTIKKYKARLIFKNSKKYAFEITKY
jgi:acetolactate synthase-1/3 small subunit